MTAAKMKDLTRIADATFLASQTKLAELRDIERALRDQLADLSQSRKTLAETDRSSGDAALTAGADARWLHWIAVRQTKLNSELAALQARKAAQFDIVKKTFGRRQAMRALLARELAKAAQDRDRRTWL